MKMFLTGLGVGLGAGLLIAPRSGESTRQQITHGARRQAQAVKRLAQDPHAIVDAGREKVQELGDRVSKAVEQGKEQIRHAGEKLGVGPVVALNTVSRDELLSVYGIGPVLADRIIEARPYESERAVVERGILSESTFTNLEKELLHKSSRSA